jgi:hypothetical protein
MKHFSDAKGFSELSTIAQHKSRRRCSNKWTRIKAKLQKLTMALRKTGRHTLQVFRQEVLCLFLEWNGNVLCCILVNSHIFSYIFYATVEEMEVLRRGKELDFSQGREESLEVKFFVL